jgi:hypothetical protein
MYLKDLRFLYVYFLLNDLVEERCFHIHLMYPPPHNLSNRNNSSNRSILGQWNKCLLVIHSLLLRELSRHKPRLELLDATICNMFDLVETPGTHN